MRESSSEIELSSLFLLCKRMVAFIDYEGIKWVLLGVALFMMAFYSDMKRVIWNEYSLFFQGEQQKKYK